MKYKIRKVTYGDRITKYYPMVTNSFLSRWIYFYNNDISYSIFKAEWDRKCFLYISAAKKFIDQHKRDTYNEKITGTKDILID